MSEVIPWPKSRTTPQKGSPKAEGMRLARAQFLTAWFDYCKSSPDSKAVSDEIIATMRVMNSLATTADLPLGEQAAAMVDAFYAGVIPPDTAPNHGR